MILFIFEGEKREIQIHKTIQYLYFTENMTETRIVSYCSNIYALYKEMKQLDSFNGMGADIVEILKTKERTQSYRTKPLHDIKDSDAFSEIYLFFDYDIKRQDQKNHETVEDQNKCIKEMLNYFDNETEHGKLYINYPMIESIRYFKKSLPDNDYAHYTTDLFIGKHFKQQANDDSYYKNFDFICFKINWKKGKIIIPNNQKEIDEIKNNWEHLKNLNTAKAHYICSGNNHLPTRKSDINQLTIFEHQIDKYVIPYQQIAILNAFPLFIYDYIR